MPIVMTRTGKQYDLESFTERDNSGAGGNWELHLYKNNYTPTDDSASVDFTECDYPGYASQFFGAWSVALPASGNPAVATNADVNTFQPSSDPSPAQTCYGYWIVEISTVKVLWAERFATPFVFNYATDQLILVPQIKCDTF